jgi:Protein of unknown function (DUF2934)
MTSKSRNSEILELHVSPSQPGAEDTSANHALNHNEIRRRAYEIYLERGGLPGYELEDWLQAESELESAARFTRELQQRHRPNSGDRN